MLLKFALSLIIGGFIGWERQQENKPAGLRTHILVCLGSALFVMISLHNPTGILPTQVIQGVAQGIGFLGAGEILRQSDPNKGIEVVHGLTSAAAIWVVAALGVAIGAGLYPIAITGALFTWGTLKLIKQLEA